MSNDRNSRLYRARDSLNGRNSAYGRSSLQSGNNGQTGRSSLSPRRTTNGLSPVQDRSSVSQRTSTMAVVNPPSINSNNRRSVQIHTPSRNTSSTAYYSPKDNSGNLKCRICENVYTHPIILPCQHTFCFGCIAAICR